MRHLLLLTLFLTACPHPPPGPGEPPGIIQCGTEAVQTHWPQVLPAVNACLVDAADGAWVSCLVGLISPAVGITEAVIACLVQDRQASFADAASRNPGDVRSSRGQTRAAEFIRKRHYQFAVMP